MPKGEGDYPLLDQHAELIGHARRPALSRAQHLWTVPVQLPLPPVIGRGVDPHGPTRRPHIAQLGGDSEGP
jgi:hypothetical protein